MKTFEMLFFCKATRGSGVRKKRNEEKYEATENLKRERERESKIFGVKERGVGV